MLVGDIDSYMLGNAIADYLNRARDLPLASAISMTLTLVTTAGILWILVSQRVHTKRSQRSVNLADKDAVQGGALNAVKEQL